VHVIPVTPRQVRRVVNQDAILLTVRIALSAPTADARAVRTLAWLWAKPVATVLAVTLPNAKNVLTASAKNAAAACVRFVAVGCVATEQIVWIVMTESVWLY
jgi:hypothetical protein